jgi:hypothetical protein
MAYHPGVQQIVAEIVMMLEGMIPHVERIAEDWASGVDHGALWPAKLVAVKYHCPRRCIPGGGPRPGSIRGPWDV